MENSFTSVKHGIKYSFWMVDWAHQIRRLLELEYPNCLKIRLVMDNLSTHIISSLYEAFPPDVARNLAKWLEIHYTLKHGSWLNIAEIALSSMTKQCLDGIIDNVTSIETERAACEAAKNTM